MEQATSAAASLSWSSIIEFLKSNGIDSSTVVTLGKNLVVALVIFYVGRFAISIVVRGLRKLMQKQEVEKRSRPLSATWSA